MALVACADELPEGSRLERTRVLAVVASPTQDPTRAWPRPGEEATLDVLVAGPGELPALSWHVEVRAGDGLVANEDGAGMPSVRFVVPADAEALHVLGHLTPAGEPETDFAFDVAVARDGDNHHPSVGAMSLPDGCVVAGGPAVEIGVMTRGEDREAYVGKDGAMRRESLRLSFFASAGELARQYAVVEADDPREQAEVAMKWTPPAASDVPDEGAMVRVIVVVRDLRGGVDFDSRTLCVRKEGK